MSDIATKLTYLDGTREKILTETNRLGVGLTEQDKFRDYAKGLHDGYVDILNNGTDTLYDNMEKVSGSGSDITLENIEEAPMRSELQGNTTQSGTPTPSSPQPINVVSGLQEVSVVGKNYFDNSKPYTYQTINNYLETTIPTGKRITWISSSNITYQFLCYAVMDLTNYVGKTIRFKTDFSASGNNIGSYYIGLCNADGTNRNVQANANGISGQTLSFVVPTLSGQQKYLCVALYVNLTGTLAQNDYVDFTNMVLTIDNEDMTYEEFKGQSYEINLGKNLFDINSNATTLGIEYSFDGSELSLNGTTTNAGNIYNNNSNTILLKSGTYTFSTTTSGALTRNGKDVAIYLRKKSDSSSVVELFSTQGYIIQQTFTINEDTELYMQLYTNGSGFVFDYFKIYLMLEKGSQATSYSAYKTPIELCKINTYKDMIFRSKGVNLFDGSIYKESVVISSTGVESYNGNFNLYKMYLKPNTTYTIQFKSTDTTVRSSRYIAYKSNDTFIEMVKEFTYDTNENVVQTFTTPNETSYVLFHIGKLISNVMINEGTTALPYEPYNSKGKWLLHKEIGKVVLNGSENWTSAVYGTNSWDLNNIIDTTFNTNELQVMSSVFKGVAHKDRTTSENNIIYSIANKMMEIRNTTLTTQAQVQSTTNGTPIYYILATPTTTEITDTELISQLEELYNAKSNKDVTYISVISEYLPAILNVIAIKNYE